MHREADHQGKWYVEQSVSALNKLEQTLSPPMNSAGAASGQEMLVESIEPVIWKVVKAIAANPGRTDPRLVEYGCTGTVALREKNATAPMMPRMTTAMYNQAS